MREWQIVLGQYCNNRNYRNIRVCNNYYRNDFQVSSISHIRILPDIVVYFHKIGLTLCKENMSV